MPSTLGTVTRNVFEYDQAHKLHLEFVAGAAIQAGELVKLEAAGTIIPAGVQQEAYIIIGIAKHTVADTELCTVAMRGYIVVWATSDAALVAGPVETIAYNTTNDRPSYIAATLAGDAVGFNLDNVGAADLDVKVVIT